MTTALLAGVIAAQGLLLAMVWPYPLAAYNPLLGGAPTAGRWISVGWGEGMDQLAPILNGRPDAERAVISSPYPEVLQAQIRGRAVDLDAPDVADYLVTYVAADQRHLTPPAVVASLAGREPLAQVTLAGVPYAALYALDPPTFEGGLRVRQADVSPRVSTRRGWVTVRLALEAAGNPTDGQVGIRTVPHGMPLDVEIALANAARPDDVEASVVRPVLADAAVQEIRLRAPDGLGRYVVGVRVRDPRNGRWLAVTTWPAGAPRQPDRLTFPSLGVRAQ